MTTYATCPVCQNINGAGLGDCPGHDEPQYWCCMVCGAKGFLPNVALCYAHRNDEFPEGSPTAWEDRDQADEPDHDCTIPTVCGLTDPFSEMAGMSGPDHIMRCSNAPDPNVVACQCGGKTPLDTNPSACQWCGERF
jgi:acyl transferase domain-containing protein